MDKIEFSIDELFILLKCASSRISCIKEFVKSESESGAIVDTDDVDLVRSLRKVCQLIESKVELPF